MKFHQLFESDGSGTFVAVRLTDKSAQDILDWLAENKVTDITPKDELHVTLVISKTEKLDYKPIKYKPPLVVEPDTFKIELFGQDNDVMVLTFDCPQLEARHKALRKKYNLDWDWPTYEPHITLTTTIQEITEPLEPPTFRIELDHEFVEPFEE
jgi:2'-5' RNA ligase